jgi:hypothetical protein
MSLLKDEWINREEDRQTNSIKWLENFRFKKPIVHAHSYDGGHHHVTIPRGQPGSLHMP